MKTIRHGYGMSLAALVVAWGLVDTRTVHARTIHARTQATHLQTKGGNGGGLSAFQLRSQERLCNLLMNKLQGSINHNDKSIAKQNLLIQKELGITDPHSKLYVRIGRQINHLQLELNGTKPRLLTQDQQVVNCLNLLARLKVTNPTLAAQLAAYLQQAFQRAAFESQEVAVIVNRPPATPFVPF